MKTIIKNKIKHWINKYGKAPLRLKALSRTNPNGAKIISRVRKEKLTYLNTSALIDLFNASHQVELQNINGVFIEAGCALGGSALVIASGKSEDRQFLIFDTFGMIPPPSDKDGEDGQHRWNTISSGKAEGLFGDQYYGYKGNLFEQVKNNFVRFGFSLDKNHILLVPGLFEDTLLLQQPVALAHLDCDWYDSVMTCLERIEPMMIIGGRFIIDDYEHWSGCKKAVDEFFLDKKNRYSFEHLSRLHIIKTG